MEPNRAALKASLRRVSQVANSSLESCPSEQGSLNAMTSEADADCEQKCVLDVNRSLIVVVTV